MSYPASGSIGNTKTLIKGSKGYLTALQIFNGAAAASYLQIFDSATTSAVVLGTTPPTLSFGVPTLQELAMVFDDEIQFVNGIVIAITTTRTGSTNPSATVDYNLAFE